MRCKRADLEAEVIQFELGKNLEDGYELWSEVVTKGWIVTDFLVKLTKEDGNIVCPYIKHRRGRTFIGVGDYVIIEDDGTKHICGADKIFQRYKPMK